MKANELDRKFDDNQESILEHFDLSKAERVNIKQKKENINLDMPSWMVQSLDEEAARLGIAREAVIKTWLADRIKEQGAR